MSYSVINRFINLKDKISCRHLIHISKNAPSPITKCLFFIFILFFLGISTAVAEILFYDDFETGTLSKWMDMSKVTINSDLKNTNSGKYSLQLRYTQGSDDPGGMWKKNIPLSSTGETYIRWYQKWDDTFIFNPVADQKLLMIYGLNPPDEWGQTSDWRTYVHLIGTEKGSQPNQVYIDHLIWSGPGQWDGIWRGFQQNIGSPYGFATGKWECIEVMIKLNTIGKNDGAIKLWLNGNLKMQYQDVSIRNNSTSLNAIAITGWYNNGAPKTQYTWMDDIVVSDQYVGPSQPPISPTPSPPTALSTAH